MHTQHNPVKPKLAKENCVRYVKSNLLVGVTSGGHMMSVHLRQFDHFILMVIIC